MGAVRCLLLLAALVPACGGPSSPLALPPPPDPELELTPQGDAWSAKPVRDGLASVSNDGTQYTGEIHRYRLLVPAAGRLQVALTWDHAADFDLVLAADEKGLLRLAEGVLTENEPEYVGLSVAAGQTIFVIVAGWTGAPGPYTLETLLLPAASPVFAPVAAPDFAAPHPRNRALRFAFNASLDPTQDIANRVTLVATGHLARGVWCVDGPALVYYPALPQAPEPFDEGGMKPGLEYTLQLRRAGRGLRSVGGEYLEEVWTRKFVVGPYEDEDPASPPRVTDIDKNPEVPWSGNTIIVTILGALDPTSVSAQLTLLPPGAPELPIATRVRLDQEQTCESHLARLHIDPGVPLPTGVRVRLNVPGTLRGITGDPAISNRLAGLPPAPPGSGYEVTLLR
ncbi:MAG: hypothetical protein ACT4PV_09020 [Planctomycetaceae bacterium]